MDLDSAVQKYSEMAGIAPATTVAILKHVVEPFVHYRLLDVLFALLVRETPEPAVADRISENIGVVLPAIGIMETMGLLLGDQDPTRDFVAALVKLYAEERK